MLLDDLIESALSARTKRKTEKKNGLLWHDCPAEYMLNVNTVNAQ